MTDNGIDREAVIRLAAQALDNNGQARIPTRDIGVNEGPAARNPGMSLSDIAAELQMELKDGKLSDSMTSIDVPLKGISGQASLPMQLPHVTRIPLEPAVYKDTPQQITTTSADYKP